MVELILGKKYRILELDKDDAYNDSDINPIGKIWTLSKVDDGCIHFKEGILLSDGLILEEVSELPPPEAEAYTMPEPYFVRKRIPYRAANGDLIYDVPAGSVLSAISGEQYWVDPPKSCCNNQGGPINVPSNIPTRQFESGAVRDSNIGKPRPDLISPYFLESLGQVLAKGAVKYGDRNWEKGMPQEVFKESAARHYVAWMMGKEDEDHAVQLAFNLMAWIHFRDKK